MKNLVVLILGLTMLTACGKQVGKDVAGTPPVVTPNPGTANPPSNPSVIYSGLLAFNNNNAYSNSYYTQDFSIAPLVTDNHVPTNGAWVTIVDVDRMNTGNAPSIKVTLFRLSDLAETTQCILNLRGNSYVDSRTTQSLNVDCQFYVPQGYTMVMRFTNASVPVGASVHADIDIIK